MHIICNLYVNTIFCTGTVAVNIWNKLISYEYKKSQKIFAQYSSYKIDS